MLVIRAVPDKDVQYPLMEAIPKLCKERDEVLAAIRRQAGPTENTVLGAG